MDDSSVLQEALDDFVWQEDFDETSLRPKRHRRNRRRSPGSVEDAELAAVKEETESS